jgi:hypothetical protein
MIGARAAGATRPETRLGTASLRGCRLRGNERVPVADLVACAQGIALAAMRFCRVAH